MQSDRGQYFCMRLCTYLFLASTETRNEKQRYKKLYNLGPRIESLKYYESDVFDFLVEALLFT
jgi:hypothetical protein